MSYESRSETTTEYILRFMSLELKCLLHLLGFSTCLYQRSQIRERSFKLRAAEMELLKGKRTTTHETGKFADPHRLVGFFHRVEQYIFGFSIPVATF